MFFVSSLFDVERIIKSFTDFYSIEKKKQYFDKFNFSW